MSRRNNNFSLSWLERMVQLIDRYGIFKIISAIALVGLFGAVLYTYNNPEKVLLAISNYYKNVQVRTHDNSDAYRSEINLVIQRDLSKLTQNTNASRSFIFEFHNGKVNADGIAFKYADMTYEDLYEAGYCKRDYIAEDFKDLTLSLYPISSYLHKYKFWKGKIDRLKDVDPRMYRRLLDLDVKYAYLMLLVNDKRELGIVGIFYHDKSYLNELGQPKDKIESFMLIAAQNFSQVLSNNGNSVL